MPISDSVATATQIRCFKQDAQTGVATGFFIDTLLSKKMTTIFLMSFGSDYTPTRITSVKTQITQYLCTMTKADLYGLNIPLGTVKSTW